jgi:hypothetical protein
MLELKIILIVVSLAVIAKVHLPQYVAEGSAREVASE